MSRTSSKATWEAWRYGYKYELYDEGRYAGVDEFGDDACATFYGVYYQGIADHAGWWKT